MPLSEDGKFVLRAERDRLQKQLQSAEKEQKEYEKLKKRADRKVTDFLNQIATLENDLKL